MTHVKVQLRIGDATYERSTADIFENGALTITAVDNNEVIDRIPVNAWERCSVVGSDGYVDFSFANDRILRGEVRR